MAASSSAAQEQHHQPNPYSAAATTAPPPTPSAQPHTTTNSHAHDNTSTSASVAADTLSRLLNRLPAPSLSLPSRRRPSPLSSSSADTSSISPPLISLSDHAESSLLSAASEHGFFQLTGHKITSQLAHSAELEALALFELSEDEKEMHFPRNWPLGYEADEDGNNGGASFWLDDSADNNSAESLSMTSSLRELTRAMEGVGLEVMEMLARAVGFENPTTRVCSMMVVSESCSGGERNSGSGSGGGLYPYVVGLQYQIRRQKHCLLGDSGSGSWITVLPEVESVLVTVGDIGQVWSNGKLKKVRGMGLGSLEEAGNVDKNKSISMRLLITLPLEDTISPLVSSSKLLELEEHEEEEEEEEEVMKFRSFGMEDYAWRVYHESFIFKDPLHRYRSSL
ncbi:Gibberellin 2-beta-dioxygenase 1 [Linum grandiflorum]